MREIKLTQDTINDKDISDLIKWLSQTPTPRLTKGEKTIEFEKKWSEWLGVKHSVFVNSGSSANLLMLYSLVVLKRLKNNKIVVPSLAWATDLAPVMQLGLEPIIVDCNLDDLSVDIKELERIFNEEAPSALILVSVLGLSPKMDKITSLCHKHGVILLEDTCESLGSMFNGKKLGTFGDMSSFSMYYGHHISTLEGGMICTNDDDLAHALIQLRSHGWDRDLPREKQIELREKWDVDDFSALYTFYVPGFNVRSTDLQAVIGIMQLEKLDNIIGKRNENFKHYINRMKNITWTPTEYKSSFISNFCLPIIDTNRDDIAKALIEAGVECRPLISGQMGAQPFYVSKYGFCNKKNASKIDKYGMYIPNNHNLSIGDIDYMCDIIIKNR